MRTTISLLTTSLALFGCEVLNPGPGPQPYQAEAAPSGSSGGGAGVYDPGGGGGGSDPGGGASNPGDGGGGFGIDGEALYIQYCAVCHGADGGGAGPYPGSIQGQTEMFEIVYNGEGEMPAFAQLTVDDVLAMEAYLATFVENRQQAGPMTGVEVFATTCAGCHGAAGEGHDRGPQLRFPVVGYATYMTRNGRSGRGFADPMPGYDHEEVTDGQLSEMWGWLHSGRKPGDGAGLWKAYCGNCHGADGRGGPVGESVRGEGLGDWIEVTREGEGGRNYRSRGDYMPAWSSREITNDEIRLMYDYIRGGGGTPAGGGNTGGGEDDDDDDSDDD